MPKFAIEIERQVLEIVEIIIDGDTQEQACDEAYKLVLSDDGEVIQRYLYDIHEPHTISIKKIQ